MKRLFDIVFSGIGLLLFLLPILLIAGLIKILMPGPIIFSQKRIGKYGKSFKLYKFRSMLSSQKKSEGSFDLGDASRVTPLGSLLRATKLDELPQLFNVLIGQMSLVGPRPEVEKWTSIYPEKWKIVHRVRPGITDNASIIYRNEEDILKKSSDPEKLYREGILPQKLDLYIQYVNHNTLLGDISIIFKTIRAIIFK